MTIRDAKRNFVVDTATELFLERPISSVTVKDIARASGLGEATVYRYFAGKKELVVACALKLQAEAAKLFESRRGAAEGGYRALESFYRVFLEVFETNPRLYRFLSEFDAFCIHEKVRDLAEYEDQMDLFKQSFLTAYQAGVRDGSVRAKKDENLFYYATTHAILSLCKKLAGDGVLEQDGRIDPHDEIETLIRVILFSLKTGV